MHWMKYEAWIDLLELVLVAALGVGLAQLTWLAMAPAGTAGAPSAIGESAQPRAGPAAARRGVRRGGRRVEREAHGDCYRPGASRSVLHA